MLPSGLHTVYVALGSNLGDRLLNLERALAALETTIQAQVRSPIYETDPWGYVDQPAFLNQVVSGQTGLTPQEFMEALKDLEFRLGRRPTFRNGPRLIDLDLLFYDDWIMETPTLSIPHPRLHERSFVLAPLADLAPDLRHPLLGKTVRELLQATGMDGVRLV